MDSGGLNNQTRKPPSNLNIIPTSRRSKRSRRLLRALFFAVLAHLILALALPELPKLIIPTIDRGRSITVFLRPTPEPEVFEQSLENPGLLSEQLTDNKPTAGIVPSETGEQEKNSETAPELSSEREDRSLSDSSGSESEAGIEPSVFIMRSSIQVFAKQEAYEHAERNPDAVDRFQRSFRSYANYRRRSRSDNYVDRYGDYYVRASSSTGDICFKQEKEPQTDDFSTNMVMFFSCERGPIKLVLESESDVEPSSSSATPMTGVTETLQR